MYAKVIVDINSKNVDRLFDYIINIKDSEIIQVGMRVIVPFGAQTRMGYVIELVEQSNMATREIIEIIDIEPTINLELFKYVDYIKTKNNTTLISVLETILPSEIFLKYSQEIEIIISDNIPVELLKLLDINKPTPYTTKLKEYKSQILTQVSNGNLKINRIYEQKGKVKYINVVDYIGNDNYKNLNKYIDLVEFVKEYPSLTKQEIEENGFSISSINTLIKNNVFISKKIIKTRDVNFLKSNKIDEHTLTDEQENAYNLIRKTYNTNEVTLLKGITGSGKTEVYMRLMDDVLKLGMNVLYLVPEISLVAPLVQQLMSRFNEKIVHYNSSLSVGERYDSYLSIIRNEARIIVGTRSSSFLPINNLGIIIMDEEQDSSYIQNDTFKQNNVQYDTLDILKMKSNYHNVPLILGTATPKVNTMYSALNNEYNLVEINNRATNMPLPEITFVDMKLELKNGNTSIFSTKLKESIEESLKKNEQTLLLYNRKGYSTFSMCRSCGYTPKCKNCDISLTYYKNKNQLVCSYCNHKEENISVCPECGKHTIKPVGFGIDKVVEVTKKAFPNARVAKIDSTNTTKKGSYEKLWYDFNNHEYDILVGTKMISKGLDFPKVTLVGVLMADLDLKSPTYLASEETYSLIAQMTGRSGRQRLGKAVIQGYELDNYAISSVGTNYDDFYKKAIYDRQITKYEPFYMVRQLLIKDVSYLAAYNSSVSLVKELKKYFEIVLGPTEPVVKVIKNEYRFLITIKDKKINEKKIFESIDKLSTTSIVNYYSKPEII